MVKLKTTPPEGTDFETWFEHLSVKWSPAERARVRSVYRWVEAKCHGGGATAAVSWVQRNLSIAGILVDLRLDHETVAAALLHEAVEKGWVSPRDVIEQFGDGIGSLVSGVTKLNQIATLHRQDHHNQEQLESLRKMLLAMARDVRVVLIKLAIRLARMRDLEALSPAEQRRLARETLNVFTPLANRLGIGQVKWELEDLALRYLEPEAYKKLACTLEERRADRELYLAKVMEALQARLQRAGIGGEIYGRVKHIYSIWRKMKRKQIPFEQIFDIRAVRIMVDSLADCYAALGVVHSFWAPIPNEFDDYIANPKENGYQSLHTAVLGPEGKIVEVQIRTGDMHQDAELGVAAHWRYKEGGGSHHQAFERQIAWLRQILEWKDDTDAGDFLDRFKAEAFQDRVYVMTPKGKIVDLIRGATPLDFAYHIHTEVGNRCRGAKVNGRIVPLNYELNSGEQVEVLTGKTPGPSRDWLSVHLGYLKTSRARVKVRHWFKQQDQAKNIAAGWAALEREFHRLGIHTKAVDLSKIAERFNFNSPDELFAALGHGDITMSSVVGRIQELILKKEPTEFLPIARKARSEDKGGGGVNIRGVGKLLTQMAQCCKPLPCDPIVGFITRGRGVSIHRQDCPNVLDLASSSPERLIEVDWGNETESAYAVEVQVDAYDRPGLLRDISSILANERVNVLAVNTRSDPETVTARMALTLEITDVVQLSRVLDRMNQLPNVAEARRKE